MRAADMLDVARSLHPLIERFAAEGEAQGALASDVIAAFHEHRLFGLYIPPEFGGLGLTPVEALEVLETISHADAAAGWVLMVAAFSAGSSMAYLPEETARDLFAPGKKIPGIAGMGAPIGKAEIVDKGFRLSGSYRYASGAHHADYIVAGCTIFEKNAPRLTAQGTADTRLLLVPRDRIVFGQNWDVMGLRATGSIDFTADNVFVPETMSYPISARDSTRGSIYRLGMFDFVAIGHSGVALGAGRRLLDELARFAQGKTLPGGIGASESFQEQFAHHEARLRAARAFLMQVWHDVDSDLKAGKDATTRQISLIRLSLNHVTTVAADIATFAYRAGGGTALRAGVIQRFVRDMLSASQHIAVSVGQLRAAGKEMAGLAPGARWAGLGLVDPPN
jgi:alkylation response protein AidB-like acyl-CoA dehydrogenase